MPATMMSQPVIRAPRRLVTEVRAELRDEALRTLEVVAAQGGRVLVIDLADVVEADIGGIGILVLIQKRAHDRGMSTRLANCPVQVERLLALTQLEFLFEIRD